MSSDSLKLPKKSFWWMCIPLQRSLSLTYPWRIFFPAVRHSIWAAVPENKHDESYGEFNRQTRIGGGHHMKQATDYRIYEASWRNASLHERSGPHAIFALWFSKRKYCRNELCNSLLWHPNHWEHIQPQYVNKTQQSSLHKADDKWQPVRFHALKKQWEWECIIQYIYCISPPENWHYN